MRRILIVAIAVLAVAGVVGGGLAWRHAHSGSVSACEEALRARFDTLASTGTVPSSDRPAQCRGLSDQQLAEVGRSLTGDTGASAAAGDRCGAGMVFRRLDNVLVVNRDACSGLSSDEVSQIAVDRFGDDVMSATVQGQ